MTKNLHEESNIQAVDLFCGAGGLTHGLAKAGIDVKLGVDIEPACEYPYTSNNKADFLLKEVEKLTAEEVRYYYGKSKFKLLAGCAPCQTFSKYNRKADETDKRWWLLEEFSRLIKDLSPELVTMENVPPLEKQNVFNEFTESLEKQGYNVEYQIVDCADYGVPQKRKRLVLLASKLGKISLISPKKFGRKSQTVREAIGELPPIKSGESDSRDTVHFCAELSELNMQRMKISKPGRTWRDWPEELIAECHKRETGYTYGSVYSRMTWDKPSPTITTHFLGFGNGRFGHPKQDRALSIREGAILQSFPPDYKFVRSGGTVIKGSLAKMIGNAVPVTLGEVIGRSLQNHVLEFNIENRRNHERV